MSEESKNGIQEEQAAEEEQGTFAELLDTLKQQRDELKLQLHLGKAEAKDELEELEKKWTNIKADADELGDKIGDTLEAEWEGLEKKLDDVSEKMQPITDEAKEVAGDVGAAVTLVAEEIKNGYDRLRKLL